MVTEVCPPAFPPVSISMGTKTVSIGSADSAPSKCPRIVEVKVADTISSNSHGMRLDHVSRTPVLRYGLSVGTIAAIFSMSSVTSSSMTSMASSTVTIPTSRCSLSTIGSASKSYREISEATVSLSSSVEAQMTFSSMIFSMLSSGLANSSVRSGTIPCRTRAASVT